jgi:hypothetical protein
MPISLLSQIVNRKPVISLIVWLAFASAVSISADNLPSDASIKQLLEVSQVRKVVDETVKRLDTMVTQTMNQVTGDQTVGSKMQREIDQGRDESRALVKQMLDWSKFEPICVKIYRESFTQQDVDNLIALYKTPGGQALLTKMPVVMQSSMAEMQRLMQPVLEQLQRKQQELAAKVQAEKKGG